MKAEELAMLCGALSIKEKERRVGTLDTKLKEKGEQLLSLCLVGKCSRLGHPIKECSETGDGNEAITEAQLRLNVWLRSESPPKRFNNRNNHPGRRNWGNSGGRSYSNTGHGSWRPGESERDSGNRSWWRSSKLKSQAGDKLSLEPINSSMGKGVGVNALGGRTLTGDMPADGKIPAAQVRKTSQMKGISINEGKTTCLMEVEPDAGQASALVSNHGPNLPISDIRPTRISDIQPTALEASTVPLVPNRAVQNNVSPKAIVTQPVVKWKRAARGKQKAFEISDLGEEPKLGKRRISTREDFAQPVNKKIKNTGQLVVTVPIQDDSSKVCLQATDDSKEGGIDESQGRVVRPEIVTSVEVSSVGEEAPSHLQSAGRSPSARRVQ
ncbi:hypothetical protein LWI29_026071 [Acer saccharum]|uniref:Uncharacterized protein n=1 Tax=Acer saccharum TaxID=4024 RepID=A0AA39W2W8_ACESA|nr:hypothetical protein LWI29_026071 [Acer saccharum]